VKSETPILQLTLQYPGLLSLADLQTYHAVAGLMNVFYLQQLEATCAVLTHQEYWRLLDGEVEQTIERSSLLVRRCADRKG